MGVRALMTIGAESAVAEVGGIAILGSNTTLSLTAQQAGNLAQFNSKLPVGSTGTFVDALGDGYLFTATVPGRVPGSSAVYQKSIDAAGNTTGYLKTVFGPRGGVISVKDKFGP